MAGDSHVFSILVKGMVFTASTDHWPIQQRFSQ